MKIAISPKSEGIFLDKLISDLFTDDNPSCNETDTSYYKIDKEVVKYIFDKNEHNDEEIISILESIYSFLEGNKRNSSFYEELLNKDLESFISSPIIARITNVIAFHLIRKKIIGNSEAVEYKLAFRKLANEYSIEIANEEEDKFLLARQISLCIVEHNPKQTLENINLLTPGFKKATYISKNNKLVRTNLFNKKEFYKIFDNVLLKISFGKGKRFIIEYGLHTDKISEVKLDQLKRIDYFNVDYANYKAFDKDILIGRLKEKLYKDYLGVYSSFLKAPEKKYEKNEYRDKVAISLFKILKSEFKNASTHVVCTVTGFVCAELRLMYSQNEHLNSTYKHSYNQYLNKTVKNILTKLQM